MRSYKIRIHESALQDIREGKLWYNQIVSGLGNRYVKQVKKGIHSLKTNPHFELRYHTIRCLPVEKFPFMIHFEISPEHHEVIVFAVLHTSRSPLIWLNPNR